MVYGVFICYLVWGLRGCVVCQYIYLYPLVYLESTHIGDSSIHLFCLFCGRYGDVTRIGKHLGVLEYKLPLTLLTFTVHPSLCWQETQNVTVYH